MKSFQGNLLMSLCSDVVGNTHLLKELGAAWLLLSAVIPMVDGAGVKVDGYVSRSKPTAAGMDLDRAYPFEVRVLGDSWTEKTDLTNGQYFIQGCDGHNVYLAFVDHPAEKLQHLNAYAGSVFKGTYPVQSPSVYTTLPWLAYCSGAFLSATVTNGSVMLPAPWVAAWAVPLAHIYRTAYKAIPDGAGLPERLEMSPDPEAMQSLRDGRFRSLALLDESERDRTLIQLPYYEKLREPEAVYQVTSVTNVGGTVVPLDSALDMFRFAFNTNGVTKTLMARITCKLTSVELIDSVDPFPKVIDGLKNINVADYRYCTPKDGVTFLSYMVTNSVWLSDDANPLLLRLRTEVMTRNKNQLSRPTLSHPVAFIIFLGIIATPLAFSRVRQKLLSVIRSA